MRPTPLFPAIRPAQNASLPVPIGLTTPMPVTTTRRSGVIGSSLALCRSRELFCGGLGSVGFRVVYDRGHPRDLLGASLGRFCATPLSLYHDHIVDVLPSSESVR